MRVVGRDRYNPLYTLSESKTNVCARPQQGRLYSFRSTAAYHSLDGASLLALARAARRRGYVLIWVEKYMDAFLARADLLCPGSEASLEAFANSTGLRIHPVPSNMAHLQDLWVVDYE